MRLLLALLLAAIPMPAVAGLTRAQLADVGVVPPPDARLDPELQLRDETGKALTLGQAAGGRPVVLLLADYTCTTLCGAATTMAAAALEDLGLEPGRDYRPVVLGIDGKDGPEAAAAAKARELAGFPEAMRTFRFLTADRNAIAAVAAGLGYRFAYDQARDQFAHPAVLYVLAADGRLARVLAGLTLVRRDLRLAIVEAGEGRVGTLGDRIRLMCYGYDAARGTYTATVTLALQALSVATLAGLGGFVLLLQRHGRRG